jgi:hypothetical protein
MSKRPLDEAAEGVSLATSAARVTTWCARCLPRGAYRLNCEILADVCSTAHRWRLSLRDFAKVHWASIWGGLSAMVLCATSFVENSILPTLKAQMSSGDIKKILLAMLVAGTTQALISFVTKGRLPSPIPPAGPPPPGPPTPAGWPQPSPPPQPPFPKW